MDKKNNSIIMQILVIVVGLIFSSIISWSLYNMEEKAIVIEFRKDVNERANSLYREIIINLETLHSLSILFNSESISEFQQFRIEAKRILSRHCDIQALEWIPRIKHKQRDSYVSQQRKEFPKFEITERKKQKQMIKAKKRKEYFPVYYVEPLVGNETAFGYDLSSSPTRHATLKNSMDTATPQATGSITLVQENAKQKGFLAFYPIYKENPTSVEKRRENLKGFVLGVYRIGDIFTSSSSNNEPLGIEMSIIDETSPNKSEILYTHKFQDGAIAHEKIKYKKMLPKFWGRQWSLTASPTQKYIAVKRSFLPWVVFIAGVFFSVFIAIYIHIMAKRTNVIRNIITKKTKELNRANRKLKKLSLTDGLTEIANRRYMDKFLTKEWIQAIRNKSPISFILIDIDFFKLYNDNYGHFKGDECLKKVASKLKTMVNRPGDLVARYGGEEFAIVMADTKNAQVIAKKCRHAIEKLQIPHEFSDTLDVVTISVGYCTIFPRKDNNSSLIIESADKALYKAKETGRNKEVKASI